MVAMEPLALPWDGSHPHQEEPRQEEGLGRRGDWAGVGGKVEEDGGEEGGGRG